MEFVWRLFQGTQSEELSAFLCPHKAPLLTVLFSSFQETMLQFRSADEASRLSTEEIKHKLGADSESGLLNREAERRLMVHGYNDFEITKEDPLWKKYLEQVN